MGNVVYIHTDRDMCDECVEPLLKVGDELYCPVCDVGNAVQPDGMGQVEECARCHTTLATWYPYPLCPSCYRSSASGEHKVAKPY